jgi:hypothetical protein
VTATRQRRNNRRPSNHHTGMEGEIEGGPKALANELGLQVPTPCSYDALEDAAVRMYWARRRAARSIHHR